MNTQELERDETLHDEYDARAMGRPKLDYSDSLASLFHENTKLTDLSSRVLGQRVQAFKAPYFIKRSVQPYKVYPGKDLISLPDRRAAVPDRSDLFDLIDERQSRRQYEDAPLTLDEIGTLLAFTYGITREASVASVEDATQQYRAVPSPGALYPLEQYVMLFNAEVEPGLYHYRPDEHGLECLETGDVRDAVDEASFASATMALDDAGGVVLTTAVFERVLLKYGDRGYRFVCLEAGLAAQNLSLVGEALDIGTCMVGGYKDDAFHDLLDVDGTSEALLNLFVIGSA